MILTPIYEAEFLGFSYGFRPGRSQHDALHALAYGIKGRNIWWILDADISRFFDTINHEWLVRFLEHRIGDRRIIRLIQKWLKAGVLEQGERIDIFIAGDAAGSGNIAAACEYLPALRVRPVGLVMAKTSCDCRHDRRPLRGRHHCRFPLCIRCQRISERVARTAGEVWAEPASGEDAVDRVWTLRSQAASGARAVEA